MKKLLGIAAALLLAVGTSSAQVSAGQGAVAGVVTDPSKAAIPGAKVTLSNPGIGYSASTTTNSVGEFKFSPLTVVGGYSLSIIAPGFSTGAVKDITTSTGTVVTQNVALSLGRADTIVEVQGANEEQVQVDTSALSEVVDKIVWEDAPLAVRSQNNFVGLTAGASPTSPTGRGYAINGARAGTGDFLADGYDNNDQGLGGGAAGGAVVTISPDAIQEFRILASTPEAEYGRAGGFATDTVLKSGTRTLHGSAFEYNRIQAITANNFFSDRAGLRDHLVRNQYGGSLGGPIYKDRTFVYGTVEFQRQRRSQPIANITAVTPDFVNFVKSGAFQTFMEGSTQQSSVISANPLSPGDFITQQGACPVADYGNIGNFSYKCPGTLSKSASTGPIFNLLSVSELSAFPLATQAIAGGNIAQGLYTANDCYISCNPGQGTITTAFPVQVYGLTSGVASAPFNENRGTIKLDHKLSEKDQLSFTYLLDLNQVAYNNGFSATTPGVAGNQVGGAQLFGATYTRTFTPTLVNVFKASYLRHVNNDLIPGPQGVPSIYTGDSLSTGFGPGAGSVQLFTENQFGYEDSVSKSLGRHSLKFGFSYKRTRNGSSFFNDVNGTVIPWSVEGLLTDGHSDEALENNPAISFGAGILYGASASQNPTTGLAPDPYRGYRANEFAAYAQDDFKVSPRLTVNYGLRWDYFGPPHNFRPGVDSNVYFGPATTVVNSGNPYEPNVPLLAGEQGATFQLAQSNGRSTIWKRDFNNFGPRVGFAYDTFGNGKLVFRAGYGIGFDRLYNNVFENIRFNGPFFVDNTKGAYFGGAPITEANYQALYTVPFTGNSTLSGAGPVPRHVNQNLQTAYYEQFHFGLESQLPKGFILETNYVGNLGRQLVGIENIQTFPGRLACPLLAGTKTYAVGTPCYTTANHQGFSSARPTTAFGNDNFRTNGFSSNYNAAQLSLRKGFSNGFQVSANYTFAKGLDQISDVFTNRSPQTGVTSPYNPNYDYGPSDTDVRHLFVVTANYISHSDHHKLLLAGWGISPIMTARSGATVDIYDGNPTYSPNKDGVLGVQRAVLQAGFPSIKSSINHSISPAGLKGLAGGYLKAGSWGAYTCPASVNNGQFCDVPVQRNQIYGPGLYNIDMSVSKRIALGERFNLRIQAAFFDILNHPEFGNPNGNTYSATFGQASTAVNREGQLSARIDF